MTARARRRWAATTVALVVCVMGAGCVTSEPGGRGSDASSPDPPLGEFPGGDCSDESTSTRVQTDAGTIVVRSLPVFVDHPDDGGIHYDEQSGDYMDVPEVVHGEEDEHRLEFARDRALLLIESADGARLSSDVLDDLAVNAVEFESGSIYCLESVAASVEYVGSTRVDYAGDEPGVFSDGVDEESSEVLVWEIVADDGDLLRDSTPVDDGSTNQSRPDSSIVSAEVMGQRAQTYFSDAGPLTLSPPGSPGGTAIAEPAFEVLDFYAENRS